MGLEEFMEGLDEPSDDESEEQESEPNDRYKYNEDTQLELEYISVGDVRTVLEKTEYDFERRSLPIDGTTFCMDSENGDYILYVACAWDASDADCILVSVVESEDKYDVLEPHIIFPTPNWEERLRDAITTILESDDRLIYCDRCGGVRIIRKTNTTGKRIRGCSNYPECKNSDFLDKRT